MLNNDFAKISKVSGHFLVEIQALQETSVSSLIKWIKENQQQVREQVDLQGGVIFKGFSIGSAAEFEQVAKAFDPSLSNLNPFDAIICTWPTQYTYEVASPSIKKSIYPLSFHNEDSFLPRVPTTIMFYASEPAPVGGETLLVDSRKVYESLPDKIKKKFISKYIQSKLILPEAVFLANSRVPKNRNNIEIAAKAFGAEKVVRLPGKMLQFEFTTPTIIKHNSTFIWFNVLHQTSLINQAINIWQAYNCIRKGFLNKIRSYLLIGALLIRAGKTFVLKSFSKDKEMHAYSLANGEKVSMLELIQINIAYWKNAIAIPLQKGDLVLLDNRLVAHGRMPYAGRRVLLSCVGSHIKTESI